MSQCTCSFLSYTLARSVTVNVIIPGPVFSDAAPTHIPAFPYPVLYLIHGGCGNENIWLRYTSLERYAEERQIAVVTCGLENSAGNDVSISIPFGTIGAGEALNSRLTDHREISFSQFLIRELPEYVHGMFPVSPLQSDTYLAGDGYAAFNILKLLLLSPDQYRAVGMFSPYFKPPVQDHLLLPSGIFPCTDAYLAINDNDSCADCTEELIRFIKEAGIRIKQEHFSSDHWSLCDTAIVSFLDWLPRKDHYAHQSKRKI